MSTQAKSKVLVTGGAGFLGWHCVRRLAADGLRTVATLHTTEATFDRARPHWVKLENGDETRAMMEGIRPTVIVHTAALTSTGACEKDPDAGRQANVEVARNLLDAARSIGLTLPYFIYVSTDLVFDGESAPYDEEAVPAPIMEYGRTKLEAERLCFGCIGLYPSMAC